MNKLLLFAISLVLVTGFLILTVYNENSLSFLVGLLVATIMLAAFSYCLNWLKLDDRQLFKQPLFIIVTVYPIYLFMLFGMWAWKNYSIDLSYSGYSLFLEISKFPLIILASSVPLGAIVNNIHRTIQTEKQIDDTAIKNRNDIHYGHVKFILDQFDKIKGKEMSYDYLLVEQATIAQESKDDAKVFKIESSIFISQPMDLYRKIYKYSTPKKSSSFMTCPEFLGNLRDEWLKIHNLCVNKSMQESVQYFKTHQEKCIKKYSEIDKVYTKISSLLCLGGYHSDYSLALQAKGSMWQWYSTFTSCIHMYDSLRSLAIVTGLILDRVRDENVDKFFPADQSVFKIGSGFVQDLTMYFDTICIGPYQSPSLTHLQLLHLETNNED